jgi:hypothetical protein
MPRLGRFTPGKDPVPILQEAGWAPGPVWTGAENLNPIGIRSPDIPARNESQCRLSYPKRAAIVSGKHYGSWRGGEEESKFFVGGLQCISFVVSLRSLSSDVSVGAGVLCDSERL